MGRIDLTGKRFGRWLVLGYSYTDKNKQSHWRCKCDCGTVKDVGGISLYQKTSLSCGCLNKEIITKHGMFGTPTYKSWEGMLARCRKKNNIGYKSYGGRGITVCDKWLTFEGFYEDMGDRPKDMTLDRIDNNGNYCKENCRWADRITQQNNKNNNHILSCHGKTQTLTQWSREVGLSKRVIGGRIRELHWPTEKALFTPLKGNGGNS